MWKTKFGGDSQIFGRAIQVGSVEAILGGVVPEGSWRLPKKVDAWLLEPKVEDAPEGLGFVVAHVKSAHDDWGDSWHMSAPTPDGTCGRLLLSVSDRADSRTWQYLLVCGDSGVPCAAGDDVASAGRVSGEFAKAFVVHQDPPMGFLGCKIVLLLPIVYFVSLDLAHLRAAMNPVSTEYIQLISVVFNLSVWVAMDASRSASTVSGVPWKTDSSGEGGSTIEEFSGVERNGADLHRWTRLVACSRDADQLVQ